MNTSFPLRKFISPEFVFGVGARKLIARYVKNLSAQKILLVTDPGVIAAGWAPEAAAALEAEGISCATFARVSSNPRDSEIMDGARMFREEQCDMLVAVGGGSPMDCAKGIGIVVSNGQHILGYEGVDRISLPCPPLICIPTTAGSSADVSQFAIINATDERRKIAIISKSLVPDAALIDPETLTTLSPELTAHTGMDALVHAIEAYVSTVSSPITDLFALETIRLIGANLLAAAMNPSDIELRGRTMLASLDAGIAFSNASLGAVHAMAHSLGGLLDLPHGECNALLLCVVIDYNFDTVPERYRDIADALGIDTKHLSDGSVRQKLIDTVLKLNADLGIPDRLSVIGVRAASIPLLAANALKDPCMATNPRIPTTDEIESLYDKLL
ncbi:MAG TPA: alcohol dehydrogenase-like regulatory protein ErcA [Dissulfurispiraceae bacterium]|nr:alcohol dehydrogenase-like regulatory protein ErcA [Dissulfurispiraceae bacterium]